ncbi:hypothetical protein M441DRAFT_55472 [Trichoderma asperellum CBS 433.97]|uniref:Uncharacterized protein n=2 Tax=Trichoderma asperellum TaxID=101201 RepID=A0A2T3ZI27_TRIA4|nr:hypothetical protein M441DRAFT_55472 [Trichoderma asperellum CBS 433.97]PTB44423.1 hypothetical protein M441DRAFT_55472 [Trichoderma asperellum CBS 433.97]
MPKPKRPETVAVSKSDKRHLLTYLEHADPNHIQVSLWDVRWRPTHGETRSASRLTFHIGVRFVQGEYQTCILVDSEEGELPVDDTVRNWGPSMPNLGEVLQYYQKLFGVQALKPLIRKQQPRRDDDDDNEEGGSSSRAWRKKIQKSNKPGYYYYYDEQEEYRECDEKGNDIYRSYKNSSPQGMTGKIGSQSSRGERRYEERRYGERGYGERGYGERASGERGYGGRAERGYGEREYTQTSQTTYHTDTKTGKIYYIDKYGKSHWA